MLPALVGKIHGSEYHHGQAHVEDHLQGDGPHVREDLAYAQLDYGRNHVQLLTQDKPRDTPYEDYFQE